MWCDVHKGMAFVVAVTNAWVSRNYKQFLQQQLDLQHSPGFQKPRTFISTAARTSDFAVTLAVLCAML